MTPHTLDEAGTVLVTIGRGLLDQGYAFTTPTPKTHACVVARDSKDRAQTLRDVFGWNLPFDHSLLPTEWVEALTRAGTLTREGDQLRSRVRFSTAASGASSALYVHSGWPTVDGNSVFFGPDTYRFLALLDRVAPAARRCVEVGCGTGAAGLSLAARVDTVVLADINPKALFFSNVNAALNGVSSIEIVESDILKNVGGAFDLVVSNPPYLVDAEARVYRHGGADYGTALSVAIAQQALSRLDPGGTFILYSGAPIVDGHDQLLRRLKPILDQNAIDVAYSELDVDVFGEELANAAYADVERIAVVALVCKRSSTSSRR